MNGQLQANESKQVSQRVRRRRRVVSLLMLLFVSLVSGHAWALTCPVSNGTWTISMPASVVVPRDAVVGTLLTPWSENDPGKNTQWYYNCNYQGGDKGGQVGHYLYWSGEPQSGVAIKTYSGQNLGVWKTNVEGVGIAVQMVGYVYGCNPEWQAGGFWAGMDSYAENNYLCTPTKLGYWQGGGRVAFALVKIGNIKPGKVTHSKPLRASLYYNGQQNYGGSNFYWYFDVKSTDVTLAACSTPDISVDLGSYTASSFAAVGDRSSPSKFDVKINDCPINLSSVQYKFSYLGGTGFTANQGLFGLSKAASAKGVQVKLTRGDGTTTVELDKWYALSEYNKATGGSYAVPLSAAYQRVGDVTPGSADTELVFSMEYK